MHNPRRHNDSDAVLSCLHMCGLFFDIEVRHIDIEVGVAHIRAGKHMDETDRLTIVSFICLPIGRRVYIRMPKGPG